MSSAVELKSGSLLDASEQFIGHQCNCQSTGNPQGLAKVLFAKYPHAECYINDPGPDFRTPGAIFVCGGADTGNRGVINMFGQIARGKPKKGNVADNKQSRENLFAQCLKQIEAIPGLQSVAFPWQIGCGLAGGDWDTYQSMIEQFAERLQQRETDTPVKVAIYKLPD